MTLIEQLVAENIEIDFPSLSHADAFAIGSDLARECLPAPGGGFTRRVRGSLVGAIALSGLTDQEDHDLVVARSAAS